MADDVRRGELEGSQGSAATPTDAGTAGGARVVSLADVAVETRYPMLTRIEAYWRELRGNRLVPARTEVDPRRIEDCLEYAFILERIAPGMARFRLAGMHLNDLMGMEVRGMPLTAFFDPEARKTVSAALEQVFSAPAMATLTLAGPRGIGRPPLDGRLLMLPLKSDFGEVSRVLGCLATLGPVGRPPRRFEVVAERVRPLAGDVGTGPDARAAWDMPPPGLPRRPLRPPLPVRRDAEAPARGPDASQSAIAAAAAQAPRPPRAEGRPQLYIVSSDAE